MRGRKIAAEVFAIKSCDHAEAWRLRQIERVTDGHHWRGDLDLIGFADRQSRCGEIDFQHRDTAADVGQKLAGRIILAVDINAEVARFAANGVGGIKRAGWIDKKSGAAELAVLVDAMDFYHCARAAGEDVFDLLADRSGGLFLRGNKPCRAEKHDGANEATKLNVARVLDRKSDV